MPYVERMPRRTRTGPVVAATDYMRAVRRPDPRLRAGAATRCWAPTASAAATTARKLRRFFEVDRHHVAVAALKALADDGAVDAGEVAAEAIARYGIDPEAPEPSRREASSA